jgi:hypothetical protein
LVLIRLESVLSSVTPWTPCTNPFAVLVDFQAPVFETPKFGI